MPVTQTMVFTATPPTTGETPTVFNYNAIACWNDLKLNIIPDLNTAFTQMNALETNVNAKEVSAVAASAAAIGAANYQGEWVSQGYTKGQSVSIGTARFSCKLTHTTPQMPPNETYWLQIYGIDDTTPTLVSPYSGEKTQELHDAQTVAIANLASASGSISNAATPVFAPIATTPTDLPFTETIPSTNTAIFNFDDASNTMVFSKNGSFNYTSNVTFGASTTDARIVTFDIIDTTVITAGSFVVGKTYTIVSVGTTDFTLIGASANTIGISFESTGVGSGTGTAMVILGSQLFNINIAAGSTVTIPSNTLLTVGSNGIPSAPLTVKVQVKVNAGSTVKLISFSSTLITNSIVNEGALADAIHAAPVKATPIGADEFSFLDSVGGVWSLVKLSYTQLKTELFASPAFIGVPTAPTAAAGTKTTQLATTAFAIGAGVGSNQTWQNVAASRAFGTTYTNSTGKPICVMLSAISSGVGFTPTAVVSGVTLGTFGSANNVGIYAQCTFLVPIDATYSIVANGATLMNWSELR